MIALLVAGLIFFIGYKVGFSKGKKAGLQQGDDFPSLKE